jgi:hypothetical protein
MIQKGEALRWKPNRLCVWFLCLVVGRLVSSQVKACFGSAAKFGIMFDHVPTDIDAPVIVEVTIVGREANRDDPSNGGAVMKARVHRVIKGTFDRDILTIIVTSLLSCGGLGMGHGFVAGTLIDDGRHGLELVTIQRPLEQLRAR